MLHELAALEWRECGPPRATDLSVIQQKWDFIGPWHSTGAVSTNQHRRCTRGRRRALDWQPDDALERPALLRLENVPQPRVDGRRARLSRTKPARAGNWRCLDVSGSNRDTISPSFGTPEAQMSFSNEDEAGSTSEVPLATLQQHAGEKPWVRRKWLARPAHPQCWHPWPSQSTFHYSHRYCFPPFIFSLIDTNHYYHKLISSVITTRLVNWTNQPLNSDLNRHPNQWLIRWGCQSLTESTNQSCHWLNENEPLNQSILWRDQRNQPLHSAFTSHSSRNHLHICSDAVSSRVDYEKNCQVAVGSVVVSQLNLIKSSSVTPASVRFVADQSALGRISKVPDMSC